MNSILKGTAVLAAGILAGCGGNDNGSGGGGGSGQATIQFYNELTNSGGLFGSSVTVDVYANDSTTAILTGEGYTTSADGTMAPVSVNDGSVRFTMSQSSNQKTIAQDVSNDLAVGGTYTTVLMGDLSGIVDVVSYPQQATTVTSRHVNVRFINALSLLSPSTVDLTMGTAATPVAQGLDYKAATDYQSLQPTLGILRINIVQGATTLASPLCLVTAGHTYDAILTYSSFRANSVAMYCHQTS